MLLAWPICNWDRSEGTGGRVDTREGGEGGSKSRQPSHRYIINSTGFDVHDTRALLGNKLGIFILPNGCSPFDIWHLKPHQSTNGDCCLMMRLHECLLAVVTLIGSSSGLFGLFTNLGSPCRITLRQCPSFKTPVAGDEWRAETPLTRGAHARGTGPRPSHNETPTHKDKVLLPTPTHCRLTGSDELVNTYLIGTCTKSRSLVDTDSRFRFSSDGEDRLLIHSFLVQFNNPREDRQIIDQQDSHFFPLCTSIQRCSACGPFRCTPHTRCWCTFGAHTVLMPSRHTYDID